MSRKSDRWPEGQPDPDQAAREQMRQRLGALVATLQSVRANYDKPDKALHGSWYAFDHMISDEITRTHIVIAKAQK